jgi:uncharacterized protein YjbI with pentapeptide repeats
MGWLHDRDAEFTAWRKRAAQHMKGVAGILIALALLASAAAAYLLNRSAHPSDAYFNWALVLFGIGVPMWATAAVQLSSDNTATDQSTRLANIKETIDEVERSASDLRDSVEQARTAAEARLESVKVAIEGIETTTANVEVGLAHLRAEAERARLGALLTILTTPGDHSHFHGQGSHFSDFDLTPDTNLSDAHLDDCVWDDFRALRVSLERAQMGHVKFTRMIAEGADLRQAVLDQSLLQGIARHAKAGANISRTTFSGQWQHAEFHACPSLIGASFAHSNLSEAIFQDIDDLVSTCFWHTTLSGAHFRACGFLGADFRWSDLTDTTFAEIRMTFGAKPTFRGAMMLRTDFTKVDVDVLAKFDFHGALAMDTLVPAGFSLKDAGAIFHDLDPVGFESQADRLEHLVDDCPDHEVIHPDSPGSNHATEPS